MSRPRKSGKVTVGVVLAFKGDPLRGRAVALRAEPVVSAADAASIAIAESFGEYASMCFASGRVK